MLPKLEQLEISIVVIVESCVDQICLVAWPFNFFWVMSFRRSASFESVTHAMLG